MPTTKDSIGIRNDKINKFNQKIEQISVEFNIKFGNFEQKNEFEKYGLYLKSEFIVNLQKIKEFINEHIIFNEIPSKPTGFVAFFLYVFVTQHGEC